MSKAAFRTVVVNYYAGDPPRLRPAVYLPHELEDMKTLTRKAETHPPDSVERAETLNELTVIHTLKAVLDATVLTEDEAKLLWA